MHEIFNRAQSKNKLIFQKELCSWLCDTCHPIAATDLSTELLWRFNARLWGIDAVMDAYDRLVEAIGFKPITNFPERFFDERYTKATQDEGCTPESLRGLGSAEDRTTESNQEPDRHSEP